MHLFDQFTYALRAAAGYRTRTVLLLLAMAIGVGSVVVLSSLGEGARNYVIGQFSSLGTNLLIVLPGRSETVGGPPPLLGVTPRDLTLEDAEAMQRIHGVRYVAPISVGAAPVSRGSREREVTILGSTEQLKPVRQLSMASGHFLPPGEIDRATPVCVLGDTTRREMFGSSRAVGETVRIGDNRFRVIGVLAAKGESVGVDMGDVVIIPVASAQALFDTTTLFRVMVEARDREVIPRVKDRLIELIRLRHDGEDDITVVTQDAVLATFDKILTTLTLTVAAIGAISIVVAGILIMNVMLIAVSQRRSEVGLLKAIGTPASGIVSLFLAEAILLSLVGATIGLAVGSSGVWAIGRYFPAFPLEIPLWALVAAVGVALVTGLVFGVLPAMRASRLDPVIALSRR